MEIFERISIETVIWSKDPPINMMHLPFHTNTCVASTHSWTPFSFYLQWKGKYFTNFLCWEIWFRNGFGSSKFKFRYICICWTMVFGKFVKLLFIWTLIGHNYVILIMKQLFTLYATVSNANIVRELRSNVFPGIIPLACVSRANFDLCMMI